MTIQVRPTLGEISIRVFVCVSQSFTKKAHKIISTIMQFGVASGTKLSDGVKSYGAGNEKDAGLKLDPEQQAKYEEIISLLLAGGYFRARISTLDPFDKVRETIY